MNASLLFLSLCLFFSPAPETEVPTSQEVADILQATFTHTDISNELIHIPRFQKGPVHLYMIQNEFTSDITQVALNSATLVVHPEPQLVQKRISQYCDIESLDFSRTTASLNFVYRSGTPYQSSQVLYSAKVNLVFRDGKWIASRIKAENPE